MFNVIYNSRNYSILLNADADTNANESTTVKIILYYLTKWKWGKRRWSTTVEIILYYLTKGSSSKESYLQQ